MGSIHVNVDPVDFALKICVRIDFYTSIYYNFFQDYYNKHFGFGFGREPFLVAGCRVNTCTTTGDRMRYSIKEVDAIIWHFRANDRSLPEDR